MSLKVPYARVTVPLEILIKPLEMSSENSEYKINAESNHLEISVCYGFYCTYKYYDPSMTSLSGANRFSIIFDLWKIEKIVTLNSLFQHKRINYESTVV